MNKKVKAQALLELAIFGSILIFLLGILINYGLRFNYQQRITQSTFRKALVSAAKTNIPGNPTAVTETTVEDIHIPDPANPFGIGSVMPFSGSAGVNMNYEGDLAADTAKNLPVITYNTGGKAYAFKTAGIRNEELPQIVNNNGLIVSYAGGSARYNQIYGSANVEIKGPAIRIIDSSAGEIMDYEATKKQCRQITDSAFCAQECNKSKSPSDAADCDANDITCIKNAGYCGNICGQPMNVPWYCSRIDQLFSFPGPAAPPPPSCPPGASCAPRKSVPRQLYQTMGLQPGYTKITTMNSKLEKDESNADISTTDTLNWENKTTRKIIYRPYDPDGTQYKAGGAQPQILDADSSVSQDLRNKPKEWKTPW